MVDSANEEDVSKSPAKDGLKSSEAEEQKDATPIESVKEEIRGPTPPSPELKSLYKIMQKREKSLGGGEGLVGVYGTITFTGMCSIFHAMKTKCNFSHESSLVDIGAGLGRPLLHALVDPGVSGGWGIELDSIKCQKAESFIERTIEDCTCEDICVLPSDAPKITCTSVEEIETLNPYTHAYSFWEGVPQPGKNAFGRLFRKADTMKGVAVVQRAFRKDPALEMRKMGFGPVKLLESARVSMSGSGRKFMAYIFEKSVQELASPMPILPAEVIDSENIKAKKNKEAGEKWAAELEAAEKEAGDVKTAFPVSKGTRLSWAKRRNIQAMRDTEDVGG